MLPLKFVAVLALLFGLSSLAQANSKYKRIKLDGHGVRNKSNAVLFVERVLETAYRGIGYSIEYQYLPLARSFIEADQGRLDGLRARVASSAERYPNLLVVSFALFDFEVLLLGSRRHCGYCELQQLKTVATIRGFKALDDYFSQLSYQPAIVRLTSASQVLDMLQKGRVDAVILPSNGLPEQYWQDINRWSKYPLISHPDFHFLHKKHQRLIPLLVQELERMEYSGELQSLRQKYQMQAPVSEFSADSLSEINLYISPQLNALMSTQEQKQIKAIFSLASTRVNLHIAEAAMFELGSADVLLGVEYELGSELRFSDMHLAGADSSDASPLFAAFASGETGHSLKVLFEKQYRLLQRQQFSKQ